MSLRQPGRGTCNSTGTASPPEIAVGTGCTNRSPNRCLGSASGGSFHGLFGIGTNELFVVTVAPAAIEATADFDVVDGCLFEPTVRPTSPTPMTREGVYVFRFFDIDHANVDEIAELSRDAWKTFETSTDYQAEPQALFAEAERTGERGRMLLVTWYDGFESWQVSRSPPGDARDRFARRHRLMARAIPYATRLIPQSGS